MVAVHKSVYSDHFMTEQKTAHGKLMRNLEVTWRPLSDVYNKAY